MDYLSYAGIVLVTFLGLLSGITLGAISPEEVVPGRRWLLLMQKALYLILIAVVLYAHHTLLQAAIILIGAGIGYLLLPYRSSYLLFGALLGIMFFSSALLHVAVVLFLFGLPKGSLMASTRKDARLWRMLWSTIRETWLVFFLPALLLPLLLPLLVAYV